MFKADIGTNGGYIVGIGEAGNPDVMDGVNPALIIGSTADAISEEGKIITAGGIDTHVHLICLSKQQRRWQQEITTQFAGGTGPR